MNSLELTIKNLTTLRDGIKAAIKRSTLKLEMREFRARRHKKYNIVLKPIGLNEVNTPVCGTSCCILGFSPSIPGLAAIEDDLYTDGMNYLGYSERLFPYFAVQDDNWYFLFGPDNNNCIESFIWSADKIIKELSYEQDIL